VEIIERYQQSSYFLCVRFGQLMCGCPEEEQLDGRFREYLNSGMCHICQVRAAFVAIYVFASGVATLQAGLQWSTPLRNASWSAVAGWTASDPNHVQVYYLERELPESESGQYLLGGMFARLTRSPRGPFFGPQSRKCEELGIDQQRYFQFCQLINLCMASQPTKASMTLKDIRAFVKANKDPSVMRKAFSIIQIHACLEMMKEAGLVKLAGSSVLQLKIFCEE
jgi:hypothetical protein